MYHEKTYKGEVDGAVTVVHSRVHYKGEKKKKEKFVERQMAVWIFLIPKELSPILLSAKCFLNTWHLI